MHRWHHPQWKVVKLEVKLDGVGVASQLKALPVDRRRDLLRDRERFLRDRERLLVAERPRRREQDRFPLEEDDDNEEESFFMIF